MQWRQKKITEQQLTDITRQLAILLEAGIPLATALDIIANSVTNQRLHRLLLSIKQRVLTGVALAQVLHEYPRLFNSLYCNLIANGEQSGTLSKMLAMLANYREKIATLKHNLHKALIYPCCVFTIAVVVTIILLTLIVPRFQNLFQAVGAELPLLTQLILNFSIFIQQRIGWVLLAALLSSLSLKYAPLIWPTFKNYKDRWRLKLPFIGHFIECLILARLLRTLALLFSAGIPLIQALQASAQIVGNQLYQQALLRTMHAVTAGIYLHQALQTTQLFPARMIQMISIGEQAGTLESMLLQLAEHYENEIDKIIAYIGKMLEPVILTVISVIVGGIIIAMYLPLFRLGQLV